MKILKFGGKSLSNGLGLEHSIDIIKRILKTEPQIAIVVSARGDATKALEALLQLAVTSKDYRPRFEAFKAYQINPKPKIDVSVEFQMISKILEGVKLLGDYSQKIKDELLAQGELISVKMITAILKDNGVNANATDARNLIKTDSNYGNAKPLHKQSRKLVKDHFIKHKNTVNVVSGFVASDENNNTTTLGKNGSNYSASLLANFLDAYELSNYTHVNGIYTANPELVSDAQKIEELSFAEANELANFGANVLHAKTIIPLIEKNIPLRILNTFNKKDKGTLISNKSTSNGIRSISEQEDVALINIEGRGLLGKVGVDARVFKALSTSNINVSIVSQGSSERGIGIVVKADVASRALVALKREFEYDVYIQDINTIAVIKNVSVISIVGSALPNFHKILNVLIKNHIQPLLFNNSVSAENVSVVLKKEDLHKGLNVIHGELFGISRQINVAIFGKGNVGSALIEQMTNSIETIEERKGIRINIFAIANSKKVLLNAKGISTDWKREFATKAKPCESIDPMVDFAQSHHLGNLIAVDNTASEAFTSHYIPLIKAGFDLVSSNKIANTIGIGFYEHLRKNLEKYQKRYLYETNVGAGLPLIDTIKLLHLSGENITCIRGIFSGSLSYIFNTFCNSEEPISSTILKAQELGFTEPDPRIDLSGTDVARKLLILARELDLKHELEDVQIANLIPEDLRTGNVERFLDRISDLDPIYSQHKEKLKPDEVLRYVGDLSGDLSKDKGGKLTVKLQAVNKTSPLGALKGSDTIFEIYTTSYGSQPIVIQGAGAGALVTARGVFGDILRVSEKINLQ